MELSRFSARVLEGVYLCAEESVQDASQVLVDSLQGLRFVTTRLPTPFAVEPNAGPRCSVQMNLLQCVFADDG